MCEQTVAIAEPFRSYPYRGALDRLADVYGIFLSVCVQRKEGIGGMAVDHKLDLLLSRDGGCIAQVRAPPTGRGRAQCLGRGRMVQLGTLAEGVELAGRVLDCRIVRGPALRAIEAQVAKADASEVSDFAVLRQ